MIKIDAGEFFLVEPCEEYAEQIDEYKQAFLDADSSMMVAVRFADARTR